MPTDFTMITADGKPDILYTYLEWVERETTWINELSGSDTSGMECALTIAKVNAVTEFVKNLVKEDAWEIDTTNLSTK